MNHPSPHYLLRSEASRIEGFGRWRFVLQPVDGSAEIMATDVEPDVWGERLDLLTVVRALESLDQPSRVTVVGCIALRRTGHPIRISGVERKAVGGGSGLDKWCLCATPTSGNGWIVFCSFIGWIAANGDSSTQGIAGSRDRTGICPTVRGKQNWVASPRENG